MKILLILLMLFSFKVFAGDEKPKNSFRDFFSNIFPREMNEYGSKDLQNARSKSQERDPGFFASVFPKEINKDKSTDHQSKNAVEKNPEINVLEVIESIQENSNKNMQDDKKESSATEFTDEMLRQMDEIEKIDQTAEKIKPKEENFSL